jgi:proline racemase
MHTHRVFHAVDTHTEGMPTRVVTGGVGTLPGATMLDRRHHFTTHHYHIRANPLSIIIGGPTP